MPDWTPTHQHRKGGRYRELFRGVREYDLAPVVIYQSEDGTVWIRAAAEFDDGRFTPLAPTGAPALLPAAPGQAPPAMREANDVDLEPDDMRADLAYLLEQEVLLVNQRQPAGNGALGDPTVCLAVICNDVFAWDLADAEPLPWQEIANLADAVRLHGDLGAARWCCLHRNLKPQPPVEKILRERGLWDAALTALPDNPAARRAS